VTAPSISAAEMRAMAGPSAALRWSQEQQVEWHYIAPG
jgi:hypothetical protein